MDRDLIYKVATLIVGAIGTWKLIVEFLRGRHGQLREEYKFAREFLNDIRNTPSMHPFLKQKGYQAIAGDTRLGAAEIEYLLTLQEAPQALRDFVIGRQYLQYLATATGPQIVFKEKFQSWWSRTWRKAWYLMLYVVCFLLGFSPILLTTFRGAQPAQALIAFFFTSALFFPAGFFALHSGVRITRAEALTKGQCKNAQAIVLAQRQF
jgi:hypothetical protein